MNRCKIHLFFVLLFVPFLTFAQSMVKGIVTDENGLPLIYASVQVKTDKSRGTLTDADGKFSIMASEGEILVVSYIGYLSHEAAVHGGGNF